MTEHSDHNERQQTQIADGTAQKVEALRIKAAADLKKGDRVRWFDGESRTVERVLLTKPYLVTVYVGGSGKRLLAPFLAVVVEGTDD